MKDTTIKADGTSRALKAPANIPDTFAAWREQLLAGTATVDITLNEAGCEVVGTPLNKAKLLRDETAAALGLPLEDPSPDDAFGAVAKKAVDVLATLTTAWVGAEAPYTQQVAIAGMKSDTKYEVGLAGTASKEQRELARAAMLAPFDEGQGDGYITIICDGDKPTAELPILVRMVY